MKWRSIVAATVLFLWSFIWISFGLLSIYSAVINVYEWPWFLIGLFLLAGSFLTVGGVGILGCSISEALAARSGKS